MKALIFNNKVVDVQENEFDVHSSMTWVDCDDSVKIGFGYDGSNFISGAPSDEKALEAKLQSIRQLRNSLLKETDFHALSDQTLSSDMSTYRQNLRDITNGVDTIEKANNITWPTKP